MRISLRTLAATLLLAACGVGDPVLSTDNRQTGHFGASPHDSIAGR
jgi:hypothetical protein